VANILTSKSNAPIAIMPDVVTDGTKRYEVPEKWRPANIVR